MDRISIKEQLYHVRFWFSWVDPTTIKQYMFYREIELPFIPAIGQEFIRKGLIGFVDNQNIGIVKRVQIYLPYERYSDNDDPYANLEVEVWSRIPAEGESTDDYIARLRKEGWYLLNSQS